MAWLAYDLPGLSRTHRTYYIELVQQLLVFNIIGDRMYLPGGTEDGKAMGVRASHFGGLKAPNLLALVANADVRAWFRKTFPEAYKTSGENIYSQNDVENCERGCARSPGC